MYVCLQPTYERNSCEARITGIRGPQALALAPYSTFDWKISIQKRAVVW